MSTHRGPGLAGMARPECAKEIAAPPQFMERIEATRKARAAAGKSLEAVAGF